MSTNGDVSFSAANVVPPPPQSLQVAIDALRSIAQVATTAVNKLEGTLSGPAPLLARAATTTPEDSSEAYELEALMKAVPEAAAAQLKTWKAQKDLVAVAFPALAASVATPAAATNKITVQAYWWGFHFVVPEPVMMQWLAGGTTLAGVVAAIAGATGPAAPFVAAGAAYIAAEIGLMKTVDHGKGVYVSMSWFAPGIFVPTSI